MIYIYIIIYIYLFKLYQNWMMTGICFLDESQLLDCLLMGFHTSIHYHVIVITTCGTPRHCLYLGLALLRRTRPLEYLECLSPTLLGQYWLMKQNMKGTWHTRRWNGPQGKLLIGLLDVYGHRSVCLMCLPHELKWEAVIAVPMAKPLN